MKKFADFVSDQQPRHNLHITHLDEALFEGGTNAANESLNVLRSILENGNEYQLTVKWDGAPAIFAGTDPSDGQFFVGTKGVFNKSPKLYKTFEDIDNDDMPEGKAEKLRESLRLLPKLNIPRDTVLQGDLLWTTGDHMYETYEGKRYVTVHPNTLVYGWLSESDEGKRVRNAELGIVFHTTYRGRNNLSNYSATFGVNTDHLNVIPEVWYDNAYFKNKEVAIDPVIRQSLKETLDRAANKVADFDKIVEVMNTMPSSASGANIKTFYNKYIREGVYPPVNGGFGAYIDHVKSYWDKQFITKLKTESGIQKRKVQYQQLRSDMYSNQSIFESAFHYVDDVRMVRDALIETLNQSSDQVIFIKTKDGLQESSHEGYVAVNKRTGNAHKLVNRTQFSYQNFSETVQKGWQK